MMQTILLNVLLLLVIIWGLLLIRYTYCTKFSRMGKQEQEQVAPKEERNREEKLHVLVGKSKGLSPSDFPEVPKTSSSKKALENANNFAESEVSEQQEKTEEVPTISEEENELHVAYTMDTVDEDEVLREELMFTPDPTPEVSPSAILARDLVRMGRWSKHDDTLDEEDEAEVQATLSKVQGTDLIEKYRENLKAQESKHTKFLEAMRRAEEAQIQSDMVKTEHLPRQELQGGNERTLDYYL